MASITEVDREEEVQEGLSKNSNNFEFLNPIDAAKAAMEEANTPTAKKALDPNRVQRLANKINATDKKIGSLSNIKLLQSGETLSEKKGSIFEFAASSDEGAPVNKDPNLALEALSDEEQLIHKDYNLALEALLAALASEKANINKLSSIEEETHKKLNLIDELLDLNKSLMIPSGKDQLDVTQEIQNKIDALKEKGVDLDISEKKIGKDNLAEIKSLIQSRIDKCRTEVQIQFTKIQTTVQHMNSIIDTMKQVLRDADREKSTSVRNQISK